MDGTDNAQDNVQDKASIGPTNQSKTPKPMVDSDEEWTTEPESDNDNDSEEEHGHTRTKKRLFVCCDGTWQNAASSMRYSTNVARFARCVDRLEPDGFDRTLEDGTEIKDHVMQVVWYSGGVGTYASLMTESTWSGLTGAGVTSCILNAYYFLSSNYNFGCHKDEIILVGYSRGAFTVRCLAEFISQVGLLRRVALPFLGLLFQLWVEGKEEELKQLKKKLAPPMKDNRKVDGALLHPVKIRVLAEFDPVSAMVNPFQWFRNKTKGIASVQDQVPSKVENAFLAMALNEKRSEFKPMLWKKKSRGQVVSQCAFLGCHGDIGGGNADSGLSQLPLLWMISQVSQATVDKTRNESKAQFDENLLLQFATPSAVGYPREITRATSARDEPSLFQTFSSTKGEITESLTLPWKAYYLFKRPLTLWYGQGGRDRVLTIEPSGSGTAHAIQDGSHEEDGNDQHVCRLEIHFSVHMLHKKRGERQQGSEAEGTFSYHLGPLQGYNRELKQVRDDHAGAKEHKHFAWSSTSTKSSRGYCFEEQGPGELEKKLLRGWVERAELWWKHSSPAAGPDQPPEEGVEEVNAWLRFIKNWDSRIHLESNKKQTLVFFFKEMLQKDELFQPSSLGSASSAAPVPSSSSRDPKIPEDPKTTRRSESPKRERIEDGRKAMRSSGSRNRRIESRRQRDDSGRTIRSRTPPST